jgi:Methane/Phenol/Toluene Hydroxylase
MSNDDKVVGRKRARAKTWSELGDLGRKPTTYEIVTHGMNHTMGNSPLELGPEVKGNVWLREYRDGMPLRGIDWEAFRDPDQLTYEAYCARQDDAETYIDALLERFDGVKDSDASASPELMALQLRAGTPTRYVAHGLQMLSAYVQQLAPSAYVANCASFQTADLLRRIQRTAERTKMMELAHPDAGFGTSERATWETNPDWQPIRQAIEESLLEYRWDRALVAVQVVIKPVLDLLFLDAYADQIGRLGGELDRLLFENLAADGARSRAWTSKLILHINEADEGNSMMIRSIMSEWAPRTDGLIAAGSRLLAGGDAQRADQIATEVRQSWQSFLDSMKLALVPV